MTSGSPLVQSTPTATPSRVRREPDALGASADGDALGLQDGPDGVGDFPILAADQARAPFDDRHLGAEAAVHLRELQPDIAAADDHEVVAARRRSQAASCW